MSTEQQQAQASILSRALNFTFFRFIPALLVLAIIISLVQVIGASINSYNRNNVTSSRQTDYISTATALAPEQQSSNRNDNLLMVAQFATNTPDGDASSSESFPTNTLENDNSGNGSLFPTNTPIVTNTPIPPPTSTAEPEQATPIVLPTFFIPSNPSIEQIAGLAVPPRAELVPRNDELINIVLLGGDDEIVGDNTVRTDTIIIVSINTRTETVAMLSLPRDLFVYIPTPTMGRINTVYGTGEALGWDGGGFGLLRQTIFYNFGIQVHYYARVNISGLAGIIDTIGGVNIAVACDYQDFALVGADVPQAAIGPDEDAAYILPVGYYNFTGGEALWYARTRGNSDDFDRGRRQRQLLLAIFRAARDDGFLTQIPELWGDLTGIVETDIPLDVVIGLLPVARNLNSSRIETFGLIRTYHSNPYTPSEGNYAGQNVQLLIAQPIYDLLVDFYTPPPASRLSMAGATIAVYNGTNRENLDLVASERLRAEGMNAYAAGTAETNDYSDTILIDYAAQSRGSLTTNISRELNIRNDNITTQADPERTVDYKVIVGENYNSCQGNSVLPVEE
jgi:polyisoprenyl-teichoic acid--peptidoglycan teichoic acid transferase